MNEYSVNITAQAKEHLLGIGKYIAWELKAPKTAEALIDLIEENILALNILPNRYPLTEEEPWHTEGVHRMPVKNFLVYYVVLDEAQRVEVIAVIYGRRDQRQALTDL